MKFVIFHGAYGGPEGNWFPTLKESLEGLGQEVIVPKFPTEKWSDFVKKGNRGKSRIQTLEAWLKEFEKARKSFRKEKLVFIGHSLGPLFMLHAVQKYNIKLDSAIFVSPFMDKLNAWEFDNVNYSFYRKDFDFKKLQRLIPVSYALFSDNDPYVPFGKSRKFAEKMNSSIIIVKGGGHLNSEAGLADFPLVLELCKTRL